MCGRKVHKMILARFRKIFNYVPGPSFKGAANRARVSDFIKGLGSNASILNVGSGISRRSPKIINLDIDSFDNVDIVGKAQELPFKDGSFDGIVFQGVVQHVDRPGSTVKEMHRILRNGGQLYAEAPFIQGHHVDPDFQRYTISGIERLFSDFKVIEKGVVIGPSSACTWILREYLAMLFSFNNPILYKLFFVIFCWVTYPIKYLDFFLERNRYSYKLASGFYYRGIKE